MKATLNDLLNAKGVSEPLREAVKVLTDRLEAAEKDVALKEEVIDSLGVVVKRLDAQCDAAERERDECNRRRLEAADHFAAQTELMKEKYDALRAKVEQLTEAESVMRRNAFEYQAEAERLRAKIEAMERQEPVAFALYSGWARKAVYLSEIEACEQRDRRQLTADLGGSLEAYRVAPLYLAPGAKGE